MNAPPRAYQPDAPAREPAANDAPSPFNPTPHPTLDSSHADDSYLASLLDHLTDQLATGDSIAASEILQNHPEHASRLRQLLPALHGLAAIQREGEAPAEPQVAGTLRVPSAHALNPNDLPTLGDFRLLREIGRGGMGIVYEAEQLSLRRRVALKILPQASLLDDRLLKRFQTEAQAAAALAHPNIVPIYHIGCHACIHYYAMQLIDGHSLAEVIAASRSRLPGGTAHTNPTRKRGNAEQEIGHSKAEPVGWDKAAAAAGPSLSNFEPGTLNVELRDPARYRHIAELGLQAAQALHHAHSSGIIHRDIKPANLLLDRNGKLWITDFGLARIEGDANLTMTGDLLGTLRYMSPEQALGRSDTIDCRTDIYSLGATLYELLTGHPVVAGETRGQILRNLADEPPRSLRKLNSNIPIDLETIVLTALGKDTHDRYSSSTDFAADLQRFLSNKPIAARQRRRLGLRPAIPLALAASLVLALAILSTTSVGNALRGVPHSAAALSPELQAPTPHSPALNAQSAIPNLQSTIRNLQSAPAPIPPPPGLIAWWSGDGHAQDFVGGNHGTSERGAGFGPGIVGQAFHLDGIDDYIRVPHHTAFDALRELTIEGWIRCTDTNGPRVVVGKWSDPTKEWSFLFKIATEGDRLRLELNGASTRKNIVDLRGKSRLPIREWTHVAATYDGNVASLYLNGVEESDQIVGPAKYVQRGKMDLVVGANDWGPSCFRECFRGLIDELCLYNRALSTEEIWSIYQAGTAGKIKPTQITSSHRANDET